MTEEYEITYFGDLDLPSFIVALVCAPFVIALLGYWTYLIPVFALALGLTPYLLFGGSALLLLLLVVPYLPLVPTAALYGVNHLLFTVEPDLVRMVLDYSSSDIELRQHFGGTFAILWGLAFEVLYVTCRRFR